MAQQARWSEYVDAMRDHLAVNERLADRLRYYVGDALGCPSHLPANDREAWQALVRESAESARRHRDALESLIKAIEARR